MTNGVWVAAAIALADDLRCLEAADEAELVAQLSGGKE